MILSTPHVASTLIITLVILVMVSPAVGSTMLAKSIVSPVHSSYAKITGAVGMAEMRHDTAYIKPIENKTSTPHLLSFDPVHGTLIVTEKVVNEGGGNKKPSDFTITVHGNSPSPSSFQGSSSGTAVKLQMGMYSITQTKQSGYNSTFSGDCSGGMMSVETKKCNITNTYSAPGIGTKQNNSTRL